MEAVREETTVVNKLKEYFTVDISRGSKWGNPFKIGIHGSREEVINRYEAWIRKQPHLLASLPELVGHRLGCFCKPKACHGDVLIKLLREFLGA